MTKNMRELSSPTTSNITRKCSSELLEWLGVDEECQLITPEIRLTHLSWEFPDVWKMLERLWDLLREDKVKWPNYCLLPNTTFTSLAMYCAWDPDDYDNPLDTKTLCLIGAMEALGTWRYSKGVYRFDDTVYQAIMDAPYNGEMPCEILYRLPEWSVYIETPGLFENQCHGFWATLSWSDTGGSCLAIMLNIRGGVTTFHIALGSWTIEEGINRINQQLDEYVANGIHTDGGIRYSDGYTSAVRIQVAKICIQLLLYLCQDQPDITDQMQPGRFPTRPQPRRVKGGVRFFPADRVRVWTVGKETGETIRKAWQGYEHGKVRPHLRRAHWHGYWKGPLEGERSFSYKWLPPIPVGS